MVSLVYTSLRPNSIMIGSSVFAGLIGVPKALCSTHAMRHKMYSIHLLPCLQTQVHIRELTSHMRFDYKIVIARYLPPVSGSIFALTTAKLVLDLATPEREMQG